MVHTTRRARRRWLASLLVGLLGAGVIASPVAATSPNPGGINFTLPTGFQVSGKITNAAGVGVGGIDVSICPDDPQNCQVDTTSAGDGTYKIGGLTPGTYFVMAIGESPRNFRSTWYAGATSTADPTAATSFNLTGNVSGINVKLVSGFTVSGTVTDGSNPVAGVDVDVSGTGSYSALTDAQGHYTVGGMGPGPASMFVRPPFTSNFMPGQVFGGTVVEGFDYDYFDISGNVTGRDVALVSGETISGHISGLTSPARVVAAGSSAGYSLDVAPSGDFLIPALWPDQPVQLIVEGPDDPNGIGEQFPVGVYDGTVNINPDQSTAVNIDMSGGDVTGLNLTAPVTASVDGHVTGDDATTVHGWITLCGNAGCATSALGTDGAYALVNVPDGSYTLYLVATDHERGYVTATGISPNFEDADLVTVSGGDVTRDVVAPAGFSLSGHISGPSGEAIGNAPVSVSFSSGALSASAYTDTAGDWVIMGLVAGDYTVQANAPDGSNYIGFLYWNAAGNTTDYAQASLITIPAATTFITGTNPVTGATGVSKSVVPSVQFSDAVLGVSGTTVWLHALGSTKPIAGTVTYDAIHHVASLSLKAKLHGKTAYVLEVSGVTDTGSATLQPLSVQFTTSK
jgi:hypothetical protein